MKDVTCVKKGKATAIQDRLGKSLTEEQEILNRWTEYSSEPYSDKANGDLSVLNCPQAHTEDDHPIFRKDWKLQYSHRLKGSQLELITSQHHDNLQQTLADRRMANSVDPVLGHHTSQERQPLEEMLFGQHPMPMPELLTRAFCRKDWKRSYIESSLMFPRRIIGQTGLNCTELRVVKRVSWFSVFWGRNEIT